MSTTITRPAPLPRVGNQTAPDGRRFVWGPLVQIHTIGDYAVVEYLRDASNLSANSQSDYDSHGQTLFHAYIAGKDTNTSHTSLDSALVGAIAVVRRGPNDRSARAFDLMTLGVIPA